MKKIILAFLLLSCLGSFSQTKLLSKSSKITFEASVPSFEEVKAVNESATIKINLSNNEIAGLVLIRGFRFKLALMEEHFNDNYMQSKRYPKATFKGSIDGFDITKLSSNVKFYTIQGKIKIHGESKPIFCTAGIRKTSEGIEFTSDFTLNSDDFKIEIPSIISKKISKMVKVKIEAILN